MAIVPQRGRRIEFMDKEKLRAIIDRVNREIGFVPVENPSPQRARELSLRDGVRPEENLLSRGIIAMREE